MKHTLSALCLAGAALLCCCALTSNANAAESAQTIKMNMKARIPAIDKLKTQGAVGEANTGLLAVLKAPLAAEDAKTVDAENADRTKIYTAIAKQQGTTVKLVGERRARQIHEHAAKGTFIQNEKGAWAQK